MPREPTFDRDKLRELAEQHPEWTGKQLGEALGGVNPRSVMSALSRMRAAGEIIPLRYRKLVSIMPPTELLDGRQTNSTVMRYLRELAKREEGKNPTTEEKDIAWRAFRLNAERWEEKTLNAGRIVDILPNGHVEVVYATADEKDESGRTKWIARWLKPGWQNPVA